MKALLCSVDVFGALVEVAAKGLLTTAILMDPAGAVAAVHEVVPVVDVKILSEAPPLDEIATASPRDSTQSKFLKVLR
jgi:hypothetical protein